MLDYKIEILRTRGIELAGVYKEQKYNRVYYNLIPTDFNDDGDIKELNKIGIDQHPLFNIEHKAEQIEKNKKTEEYKACKEHKEHKEHKDLIHRYTSLNQINKKSLQQEEYDTQEIKEEELQITPIDNIPKLTECKNIENVSKQIYMGEEIKKKVKSRNKIKIIKKINKSNITFENIQKFEISEIQEDVKVFQEDTSLHSSEVAKFTDKEISDKKCNVDDGVLKISMEPPPMISKDRIVLKNYAIQFQKNIQNKESTPDAVKIKIQKSEPIKSIVSQTPDLSILETWEK